MALRRLDPAWLPKATMVRVITHWTAGSYKANSTDLKAYHFLIEGSGRVVPGLHSVRDNQRPIRGGYAAHTLRANTGSIGVSVCAMAGSGRSPFVPGKYPMTELQWKVMAEVVADLCETYGIAVTPMTVLGHGEVQKNLGIQQKNKWDPMIQPWATHKSFKEVGDEFRAMVQALLDDASEPVEHYPVVKLSLNGTNRNGIMANGSVWLRIKDARAMGVHVLLKAADKVAISMDGASGSASRLIYRDESYMTVRSLEKVGFRVDWDGAGNRVSVRRA
ncbi:N-acetylmuramoyl-L-alanine amidase [Kamptonema cortianum]|nr:N-acetylmuramoyl-L-alanine amidase [Geitlerinema splendidum]MDK3161082.1 N-acetylmuramoyl-L-alanine amidase [Kamptonema cortianum]